MPLVAFYRPVGDGYAEMAAMADVNQGTRGDLELEGLLPPGGSMTLRVISALGVAKGWYAVVAGQQFRVSGTSPVPPLFRATEVECERNTDVVPISAYLTVGGERLSDGDDPLTVAGAPRRLGS